DLPSARLVGLDSLLEIAVLRAREEAELVEAREVLLRLRKVVEGEVRLPDVLVRASVLGIDRERPLVDRDGRSGVAVLPGRVGEHVNGVGIRAVPGRRLLEKR